MGPIFRLLFRFFIFDYGLFTRRGWRIYGEALLLLAAPAAVVAAAGMSLPVLVRIGYGLLVLFRAGTQTHPWHWRYMLVAIYASAIPAFFYVPLRSIFGVDGVELFALHYGLHVVNVAAFATGAWLARHRAAGKPPSDAI